MAASPVWIRLVDTFTGRAPVRLVGAVAAGSVTLTVERRDGAQWKPAPAPVTVKPTGDLAFVNLGRVRRGQAPTQTDYRFTVAVDGSVTETVNREPSVVVPVTTWSADSPPVTPPVQEIRCYPAPDYQFGPGVPLVSGTVAQAGSPAAGARVRVTETVAGRTLVEEVRTNASGWFRLPLRWSSGATQIDADRAGANGSQSINIPADLGSVVRITIS